MGQAGVLTYYNGESEPERYVHGVIHDISQTHQGRRFTHYQVALDPNIQLLSHRVGLRIFQELSVKDIIETILQEAATSLNRKKANAPHAINTTAKTNSSKPKTKAKPHTIATTH